MKKLFTILFLGFGVAQAQPVVQPLASGDYWRIQEYNRKLQEFANKNFEAPVAGIRFPSGYAVISQPDANRLVGANEVSWYATPGSNISAFVVEYSRNDRDFERAGVVGVFERKDGDRYVYKHPFNDDRLLYYRIGIANNNGMVTAYSPSFKLRDEEFTTKIFPTIVRNSSLFVKTADPFEKLQILNSASQTVYEKAINEATGTFTLSLPELPMGVYFVRLLSDKRPPHVQKIFVE